MRKEERGEEYEMTIHSIFSPALLNLVCMTFVRTDSCLRYLSLWGLYDPSLGNNPPKSPQ